MMTSTAQSQGRKDGLDPGRTKQNFGRRHGRGRQTMVYGRNMSQMFVSWWNRPSKWGRRLSARRSSMLSSSTKWRCFLSVVLCYYQHGTRVGGNSYCRAMLPFGEGDVPNLLLLSLSPHPPPPSILPLPLPARLSISNVSSTTSLHNSAPRPPRRHAEQHQSSREAKALLQKRACSRGPFAATTRMAGICMSGALLCFVARASLEREQPLPMESLRDERGVACSRGAAGG